MSFNDRGIFGPDVSFYQGNPNDNLFIDFDKMRAYGNKFVIIKAGQRNYADPAFGYNWKASKAAGLLRGAYWFLDDERDGKSQAEFFWSLLEADPGEGPLVVDYEWGSGTAWQRVYDFLVRLKTLSGYPSHKLWIYTGYYYWRDFGPRLASERAWFAQFPLWLAAYTDSPDGVLIPQPWSEMTLWQKGTPVLGLAMGAHSREIDYNIFNGGVAEFSRYFDVNVGEPLPEEGGDVRVIQGTALTGVKRRTSPGGAEFNPPRYLMAGDKIEADRNEAQWLHLTKINGVPVIGDEWSSAGTLQQYIQWAWVEIVDPQPTPVGPAFSFKVNGFKEVSGNLEPE